MIDIKMTTYDDISKGDVISFNAKEYGDNVIQGMGIVIEKGYNSGVGVKTLTLLWYGTEKYYSVSYFEEIYLIGQIHPMFIKPSD